MDYRCPLCGAIPSKRRFTQTLVMGLETECVHCHSVIRVNVHPVEKIVVMVNFVAIILLAALAYWLQSSGLVLVAFGAAMLGAAALPLLEQTWLRTWPRYVPMVKDPAA